MSQSKEIKEIPISSIDRDPKQPRKNFSQLEELGETIKKYGLQNSIHVRYDKDTNKYIIISGERRWRACKEYTDLQTIPCIVHEGEDEKTIRFLQVIENVQREGLKPLEEAQAYERIMKESGIKQKDFAKEVGISETVLSKTLKLLRLPSNIQKDMENMREHPSKDVLIEIVNEKDAGLQQSIWNKVKSGELKNRKEIRRERKSWSKSDIKKMSAEEVWELVKWAVERDKEAIKILVNSAQLENIMVEKIKNEKFGVSKGANDVLISTESSANNTTET